ncbi:MAG: LssY C-terminal domain-containing protein [Gammaproteobacteria bacterium]|nr:LssY C-terminal domain-containing protein [Gammaproteobacteria bacterium]
MDSMLQSMLEWVSLHPHLSGLLIFVVTLLESLVVIGLLIPGAIVLFGVGALVATGVLELLPTLAWAATGALTGDTVSFMLGRHYHQRLRVMWPLKRYPRLVNRGIDFFYRHGGKSIFMARFVGPVRPVLPAIAGMMNMRRSRFLLVAGIASLLWAPAYILPGMVFGASLGLAAEVAGRLVVLLVVLVGSAWLGVMVIRGIGKLVQPHAAAALEAVLHWSRSHPHIGPLAGSLLDPDHPEARGLTILSGLSFITLWLLLLILRQVLHGDFMGDLDNYLYRFLQNLRTPWADQLMVFVTQFGAQALLVVVLIGGSLWLTWKGNIQAALHWIAVYACAGILTFVLKHSAQIARPVDYYGGYSFPSAHVSMSLVVYGFLALLVAREIPFKHRWLPYSIAGLLVMAIAFSRLYLGVHWFSDVLGGVTLGLFWAALIGIAYDRHPAPPLPVKGILGVVAVIVLLAGGVHMQQNFRQDLAQYAPRIEVHATTQAAWVSDAWQQLPDYRIDLEGRNEQPMNIQWAGSLQTLRTLLERKGWQTPPGLGTSSALNWLAPEPDITSLPVLPQVHDGQHHDLLLVSRPDSLNRLTVLRLWPANIEISDVPAPVWVGTVSYLILDRTLRLVSALLTDIDFNTPLAVLQAALDQDVHSRIVQRLAPVTQQIDWDGQVLLAWESGETRSDPRARSTPRKQ